jgi:peptidoglycan-N-acetylglucosamine deacetylase
MVAVTFDDGPNDTATPAILDLLAGRGVAATFFVIGAHAAAYPELIVRMSADGHSVQPHCWDWDSHGRHLELSRTAMEHDVARTVGEIQWRGCPPPTLWRPPNGDINDPQSYDVARTLDLTLVIWTLQTCDWSERHSAERIVADIDSEARADAVLEVRSVVLMHDKPKTVRLLDQLLDRIETYGHRASPMSRESAATVTGGDYRFGRRDGRTPCIA